MIRIVRMTFRNDGIDQFLHLFRRTSSRIRNMKGCTHLELLKDINHSNIYITYSVWDTEEDLNEYRASATFGEIWVECKKLFSDKPIAFSMHSFIKVE